MKRYLDDEHFKRFIKDFQFLFKHIRDSHGELDLRLRSNYFNIYSCGKRMAIIQFRETDYLVAINQKFADGVYDQDQISLKVMDTVNQLEGYNRYRITPELLHHFFQPKHLNKLASKGKNIYCSEKLAFEQALITDNIGREDYLIIDRIVTDTALGRSWIDLLGLKQVSGRSYSFELIKIKLGNSSDLKAEVGMQLESYINHIQANIMQWKENYEKVYQQLKQAGLFDKPSASEIVITPEVSGRVVVVGYSGIARKYIDILKQGYPDLYVEQRDFLL